ncbi:DUF6801 domain-containing protein [Amycolatopsis australiensis]|uniref:DUF6801 domain-containing protein n=1 Tax=Amycolatopsis australiensis TaxID=546364 RepID=A0A1K1T4R8_9PSEU|nr:DUF6801 domain-containing protein [Amycolatopsis australiensis]SFW91562.1 hypothetical protein SAMN04489730_8029 [Amycolatopsis australiensis]
MTRLRNLSLKAVTTAAAVSAFGMALTGVASADTAYNAAATYRCTFPGIPQQDVAITASLTGPDSVPAGTTVTPGNVGGTATISAAVHTLLTAVGYDGIRGTATVPVTAARGTVSGPASGLSIPETIYPAGGPITVVISQVATSSIPTYTAPATAGSDTLSLGTPITAALQFHKASGNTWANWNMSCTPKTTSPAQNLAFSPNFVIT